MRIALRRWWSNSETGVMGLKLHEDWGSMPAAIDTCLRVADEYDFQVQIHTDTLNESGFVENTLEAIGGRTIHMYHTEGAGAVMRRTSSASRAKCIACRRRRIRPIPIR